MNYQDSSSDDVPYLPPEQYINYEQQRNINRLSQQPPIPQLQPQQRRGRSHFSEDEIRELDTPSTFVEIAISNVDVPRDSNAHIIPESETNDSRRNSINNFGPNGNYFRTPAARNAAHPHETVQSTIPQPPHSFKISWGRRLIGLILIGIPAVLFSVAAHFIDWSMSDYQLFSASFFIFQGIFWPSFGILLTDLFCNAKQPENKPEADVHAKQNAPKWTPIVYTIIHSNLTAAALIFQLLSIQHLNISISLALSFGSYILEALIRFILLERKCSPELIILSIISYAGYAASAVPAFIADDKDTRSDTAIGVGASIGVMLLSIPSSFLLSKLRQENVRESALGTSFAFFGCIHSLITKEIMGSDFNLHLNAQSVGWAAGFVSVVFLGTIFLFLETKLSSLIWQRDDDRPREFSSLTRTRIAVFILSCLWELSRQGFRETFPDPFDILGGFLVMFSFLLASGFQAWNRSCQNKLLYATEADMSSRKFCAFIPWLFAQKSYHRDKNEK